MTRGKSVGEVELLFPIATALGVSADFLSPFAPELLRREREVVGQVTARIGGGRVAKCLSKNLAASIPKGGE